MDSICLATKWKRAPLLHLEPEISWTTADKSHSYEVLILNLTSSGNPKTDVPYGGDDRHFLGGKEDKGLAIGGDLSGAIGPERFYVPKPVVELTAKKAIGRVFRWSQVGPQVRLGT
jgi:hypothetical protein